MPVGRHGLLGGLAPSRGVVLHRQRCSRIVRPARASGDIVRTHPLARLSHRHQRNTDLVGAVPVDVRFFLVGEPRRGKGLLCHLWSYVICVVIVHKRRRIVNRDCPHVLPGQKFSALLEIQPTPATLVFWLVRVASIVVRGQRRIPVKRIAHLHAHCVRHIRVIRVGRSIIDRLGVAIHIVLDHIVVFRFRSTQQPVVIAPRSIYAVAVGRATFCGPEIVVKREVNILEI